VIVIAPMITNGFGDVQLLPPFLAAPARAALQGGGINQDVITPNGVLNPGALISNVFSTVTVRSTLGDFTMRLDGPEDPATAAILKRLQPSIVFSGRAGTYTIAPYGQTGGIDPAFQDAGVKIGIGVGAALLGLVLLIRSF